MQVRNFVHMHARFRCRTELCSFDAKKNLHQKKKLAQLESAVVTYYATYDALKFSHLHHITMSPPCLRPTTLITFVKPWLSFTVLISYIFPTALSCR